MPAHRKALAELEASGATKVNPGRYADRKNTPKPTAPIGTAPKHLSPEQKAAWKEVIKFAPNGVLSGADRALLEITVHQLVEFRAGRLIRASEIGTLITCLSKLGMTPSDRSRLSVPGDKDQLNEEIHSLARECGRLPN